MTKARSNATAPNAKGTLVVGNGTDASTTLAVASTAGFVLTVDSAEATGLKWAAPSAPAFVGCRAAKNATQSINDSTATAMSMQVEDYDTNTFHDNSTNNSRMTIPSGQTGYYLMVANFAFASNSAGTRRLEFRVNGNDIRTEVAGPATAGGTHTVIFISDIQYLNAGDYVEVMAWQNSGGALNVNWDGNNVSWFAIAKVG